jgi:hypothetical protein
VVSRGHSRALGPRFNERLEAFMDEVERSRMKGPDHL